MSKPSAYEQLTLEYVNALRTDPGGEYARLVAQQANITSAVNYFGVDLGALAAQLGALSAAAPLAWSDQLSASAETHSQLMIAFDQQSHNLPGEPGLGARVTNAGYTGWSVLGENVYAFADDPLHGHAGFVIDWGYDDVDRNPDGTLKSNWQVLGDGIQDPAGHRNSLMAISRTEIGIGVIQDVDPGTGVGEFVTTQHVGSRFAYQAQFVGVVIDDLDGDAFYDMGEGMGGVTVTLTGGGAPLSTQTWASGGWQIVAPAGSYTITFSGGGLRADVVTTAILGSANVKVDAFNPLVTNETPVAAVADQSIAVTAYQWRKLDSVLSVSDADGDAITLYELRDDEGGHNWWADGGLVNARTGYQTANLADIWFKRDAAPSEQTLSVRAHDGTDWGAWAQFTLTTEGVNSAPVALVADQSIGMNQYQWRKLDSVLSVTDADGDAITLYELWDSEGGHNWWADGGLVNARTGYQTADLSDIWFKRDAAPSDQTLWVRANDGMQWGAWDSFELLTV